ncbi:hypothetical protein Pmani_013657 [Petrolisthes manimaculis]|uniref:Nucleolar pre-ribosomal-associated protein 1 n=1 Tax=Petrolisthes manimaculis TaxID=1843537 RepID=A0AAE1UDE1_9EUCA|nr:hypothetical protein Pmani_013657 [Petrolisthes manimaculis]
MKVEDLLQGLEGDTPLQALKDFNGFLLGNKNASEAINDLLLASKDCEILLSLLVNNKHIGVVLEILTTLSYVLLSIADELNEFSSTGLHITRQLLNNHGTDLNKFLSSISAPRSIKAVLRCLTGMVLLGGEAANDVLTKLDWSSIRFSDLARRVNIIDERDARAWLIYFFLAFLNMTDEPYIIEQFLQKKDALSSIYDGLLFDPSERVINVLKVMHESILLNENISKTTKVSLFTPVTCQPILQLYGWIGPMGKTVGRENIDRLDQDIVESIEKERPQVKEILHKFLLTLCTSFKYGIIFKEKNKPGYEKTNWWLYTIISHLKTPWESAEGRELICKIIAYSPSLLKPFMPELRQHLEVRQTKVFIDILYMLTQMVENQMPWIRMESFGLPGALASILLKPLDPSFIQSVLESGHTFINHFGILFIHSVLSKTKETCDRIMQSQSLTLEVKEKVPRKLKESVLSGLVPVCSIVQCWELAITQQHQSIEGVQDIPVTIQLLSIAKVLTLYTDLQPSKSVYEAINPIQKLQTVGNLSVKTENENYARLELQVLCLGFIAGSGPGQETVFQRFMTEKTSLQQMENDCVYQLIKTYNDSKNISATNNNTKLMLSVADKCQKILSVELAKVGLATNYDGNVKYWLKHIPHNNTVKLSSFLTQIIQKTVSSLNHYTDRIVEAGTRLNHQTNTSAHMKLSILKAIDSMEIVDNEDISQQTIAMPFSRLVLGAIDLISSNPDPEHSHYFSSVMSDYLYSLNDPDLLIDVLLQEESIITPDLKEYLKCWHKGKQKKYKSLQQFDNVNLSELLKYFFMTHDWDTVEKYLEEKKLVNILEKGDLDLIVSQILIYICLQTNVKRKGTAIVKKYVYLLKEIYKILDQESEQKYVHCLLQMVLENSKILSCYKPFTDVQSPISELAQEFVDFVLQKHTTLAPKTSPYFETLVQHIQSNSRNMNETIDLWSPFSQFISSENTIISYEDLESVFIACLESFSVTWSSQNKLIYEIIQLLLKTTSAKRTLTPQSIHLILNKFEELNKEEKTESAEQDKTSFSIMSNLEKLMIQVIDGKVAEKLSAEELKQLMRCQPPCPDLCCHLLTQYPPHATIFAKQLKKRPAIILPLQAPLLALLLTQNEIVNAAESALNKVSEKLKTWALNFDEKNNETNLLIPHALQRNVLDVDCLTEVCKKMYDEAVASDQQPLSEKIPSLLPAFHKLAEVGPQLSKIGLPEETMALLIVSLNYIKYSYHKKNEPEILLKVANVIEKMLPKLDEVTFQRTMACNKLWMSFVKQILRKGLSDASMGPDMLHLLQLLSSMMYKRRQGGGGRPRDESHVLPITTFYKMIMSHTQYLTLMFNREPEWERLKEAIVELQQALVDCQTEVCQESHVPIFLGAYTASMSTLDQRILMMLHTYEREGHMNTIQPMLWGDAAVTHFRIKTQSEQLFLNPNPEQVLALIEMDKLLHTCRHFNTRLPLEANAVHPGDKSVYDIRFLLPLLFNLGWDRTSHLTEYDYATSGAAALGFTALTSHEREVWGIGAATLRCMVKKMDRLRRGRMKLPWQWLVGVVSCSFEGQQRRLPALAAHFLVKATQLFSQPEHPMYHPVLNYAFILPVFKTYFVPELYPLFNSKHVTDHRDHRSFLLNNLSSGIRQILDYSITKRTFTATLILGMLQSPTADIGLKVQALEVLEAMARIHLGAVDLVRVHNLLTLLPLVALPDTTAPELQPSPATRPGHPQLMTGVVQVLSTVWATLLDSVTRKRSNALPPEEQEFLPEEEEEEEDRRGKRKWNNRETFSKCFKKAKNESLDVNDGDDAEPCTQDMEIESENIKVNNNELAEKSRTRRLHPLVVHEYLNCLKLLAPSILSTSPIATYAQFLNLIADAVNYVDVIATSPMEKLSIRLIAVTPTAVKQQLNEIVNWDHLHKQLQGHLTDEEEVLVLREKAKEKLHEWRSEPLSTHLHKTLKPKHTKDSKHQDEFSDQDTKKEYDSLKQAVIKLLKILEK